MPKFVLLIALFTFVFFRCSSDESKALSWLEKGKTLARTVKKEEAIKAYSKAIDLNPKLFKAYQRRGNLYLIMKSYDEAIADFTKAIELDPRDSNLYYMRGIAYFEKSNYDMAIADFTKAVEIRPKYADAYFERGCVYERKGQYEKAIADYKMAIENRDAPQYYRQISELCFKLACAHSLKKKKSKALEYLQMATEYGFNKPWEIRKIKETKDLDFIRNEKEFKEIIRKITSLKKT